MTAPIEIARNIEPVNSGYRTVEASTTAIAAVTVILAFGVTEAHLLAPCPQKSQKSHFPQQHRGSQ